MLNHLNWAVALTGQSHQFFPGVDGPQRLFTALGTGSRRITLNTESAARCATPARLGLVIPGQQENVGPHLAQCIKAGCSTRCRQPLGTDAPDETRRNHLRFLLLTLDERG